MLDQEKFRQGSLSLGIEVLSKEFLIPVANINLNQAEQEAFEKESEALSDFLSKSSKYFVHRDFHSRNLMAKSEKLAVIDFQDARFGPPSYDAVSLCFDSYIPLNEADRVKLMEFFIQSTDDAKIKSEIKDTWQAMLLQRQLKAIGSFGYLSVKKNRGNYLKYLQPALATLQPSIVGDSRWPFLSQTMIKMMKARLD